MATINRFIVAISLALILTVALGAAAPGATVKYKTSGTYRDRAGTTHPWSINDAHTLLWDGSSYIPVGAVFTPRYLALGATEENLKADTAALEAAKANGITDIILRSGGPITSSDPAALQKIIDYLDSNGFTYGLELDDGPKQGLSGYLIAPSLYRLEGPMVESNGTWSWPGVDSATYVVASKADLSVKATGGALVKNGKVTISLADPLSTSQVMLVYPHKTYPAYGQGAIGDIWSGFGEYRDRLLSFFKQVKFGPGLRFFLEPFSSKMDFTGEMTGFLPDSSGFRLGLEAYLAKKYVHEGAVNTAWGLRENLDSIVTATRLMPMWNAGRGLSYAYDRATAKLYPVDTLSSQMWRDILAYRDGSAQEYMSTIADTLKKQVAEAPVIFKCSKYHRIYANPYGIGGFDGLGADAFGTDESLVTGIAGPVYSLAEESAKTTWFIAPGTSPSREDSPAAYPNQTAFATAMDYFREIGCKGFFVDGLQPPDAARRTGVDLIGQPSQLGWLKDFKDKLQRASSADFKPAAVYYPTSPLVGAYTKRLAPNTWWLPTLRLGSTSYIGDGLGGYGLAGEDMSYLWSGTEKRAITLKSSPMGIPTVIFPDKGAVAKKKGGLFGVTLTPDPTVIKPLDFSLVFPSETAEAEIAALAGMIQEASKAGIDVHRANEGMKQAKQVLGRGEPVVAYGMAQTAVQELVAVTGGVSWLEGEQSIANSFDGPKAMPGASSNLVLMLDRSEDAPLSPYSAAFSFEVATSSSCQIWLAGTPPADGAAVSWSADDGAWSPIAANSARQDYAPGLSWYKIGTANVQPGKHTLKFRADGKRSQDGRYYFAIDAIAISPREFKPNGVFKPY